MSFSPNFVFNTTIETFVGIYAAWFDIIVVSLCLNEISGRMTSSSAILFKVVGPLLEARIPLLKFLGVLAAENTESYELIVVPGLKDLRK